MAGIRSEHGLKDQSNVTLVQFPERWQETQHFKFESADEFLDLACTQSSPWRGERVSRSNDPSLGTSTWEEAVALARTGWEEGRDRLIRALDIAVANATSPLTVEAYDYAGAYPDVPRYLGGDLDCMMDHLPDLRRVRPIVKVAINMTTEKSVSGAHITNWGAALVSWIDELEDSGIRVEVTWISCSQPFWLTDENQLAQVRGPRIAFSFRLKDADQPVEIDRLAFWLMHPAAQRRIQFAAKEQYPIEQWYRGLYGIPEWNEQLIRELLDFEGMLFMVGEGAKSIDDGVKMLRDKASAHISTLVGDDATHLRSGYL